MNILQAILGVALIISVITKNSLDRDQSLLFLIGTGIVWEVILS